MSLAKLKHYFLHSISVQIAYILNKKQCLNFSNPRHSDISITEIHKSALCNLKKNISAFSEQKLSLKNLSGLTSLFIFLPDDLYSLVTYMFFQQQC